MPARSPLIVRIAVGAIAAICAVLIPGEAGRLMTTPLPTRIPRGRPLPERQPSCQPSLT
jgi:hypothetical protein